MKKVTTFFDKTLREDLAKGQKWSLAYRAALNFLSELIAYGTDPVGAIVADPGRPLQDCGKGFGNFVCGGHAESKDVQEAFAKTHRVEACLTLRWHGVLTLELNAYRSGARKPHLSFEFSFDRKGAPATASYEVLGPS